MNREMIHSSIEAIHLIPPLPSGDKSNRRSLLPEIVDRLKDPSIPIAEVVRLIAIEIAHIVAAMRGFEEIDALKSNMQQVRILRLLSRNLVESYARARRDVLNMDGPQFQFVLCKIMECFADALEKATQKPKNHAFNQSILKEFRDLLGARDQDIRRELAKIDS